MGRKITWIRHGQSTWNAEGRWQGHSDIELSPFGEEQARALSVRLKNAHFDAVYSSDLLRSRQTCRLALPGADMQLDSRLREIHFGVYEGQTWASMGDDMSASVKGWWADPYREKLQGGESMACLNTRVSEFIGELPEQCEIAIFTHGGVIRNAIWQVVGPPIGGFWSVQVENTSLTTIEYKSPSILVHRINDAAHLEMAT